jgi:CzcA family heavy metal efflux pump
MLNGLIKWSIQNRFLVIVLAIGLLVGGSYMATQAQLDVLPEFAPPQVIVQTEAPGLVAEEVEALVSLPLETALNGTANVALVKAISQPGISVITVIFKYGTDIYLARQLVNEKIQLSLPRLPRIVGPPIMLPVMSVVGDILKIGLTSNTVSLLDLRTIADWDIRNRVLAVPGVARVLVMGGDLKQFLVLVHPDKLKSNNITLDDVRNAVEKANHVSAGGVLVTADQQLPIRGVGRVTDINELADSVIMTRGATPLLLKHVASVSIGPAFRFGDAIINGNRGVYIVVSKQPWADTLEVTRNVQTAINQLQKGLPDGIKVTYIFRQADFIEKSIHNVLSAIFTGGVLVVIILLLFLLNWRTSIISLTAIPLSLLTAIAVIKWTGGSLNTMTLGGLAIAVGEVVDDAIVDVENVYRRLRENKLASHPEPVLRVVYKACREVRSSVVYATFIVALVFLPVFMLSGVEGRIFTPLGFAYIIATLASLLVALTVTPAMCAYLLTTRGAIPSTEPWTVSKLQETYARLLHRVLAKPKAVIFASLAMLIASLCLLPFMGQTFLPEFREDNLIIAATGLAGQSLEATDRMGVALERKLLEHPEVQAVAQRVGRAELDDDAGGPHFSEFDIRLKESNRPLSAILKDLRGHLNEVPGIAFDVGSFIAHRMDDVLSGGTRADIAIKIFGPDLPTLRELASEITTIVKTVPGTVDARPEAQVLMPQVIVSIDRQRAARYGLTAADLSKSIETAFNGNVVSQVLESQRMFGLKVWYDEQSRHNLDLIKATLVDTPSGARVPLSALATIEIGDGSSAVIRENAARRIVVQANAQGRDVVSIVNEIREKINKKVAMPTGYYIVYAGQYEAQQDASRSLFWTSALAFLGILLLLQRGFASWKATLLVISNLPLATIGGIIAVALTGNVISIGSMIGFISLFGISTRNSILLVTHIKSLIESGVSFDEAVFKGSLDRLAPVLMTALAAALGMLPLAVWGGTGRELEQPLAVVIVGGLITSTALTLLVIPALFEVFMRPAVQAKSEHDELTAKTF